MYPTWRGCYLLVDGVHVVLEERQSNHSRLFLFDTEIPVCDGMVITLNEWNLHDTILMS